MMRKLLMTSLLPLASLVVACGDDGTTDPPSGAADGDGGAGGSDGSTAGAANGGDRAGGQDADGYDGPPQYLVSGAVFTPDGQNSYVTVETDVSAAGTVDLGAALEGQGFGAVAPAPDGSGTFFIGLADQPVVQRYEVDDDGAISLAGEVSFGNLGLTAAVGTRNPFHFASSTKAYFIDIDTLQIVLWNPEEMTVNGSVDIGDLAEEGVNVRGNFVERDGDTLVMSTRHFRDDMSAEILGKLMVFDMTTDTVTVAKQTTCGNLAWSAKGADGAIYFASHPSQAARRAGGLAGDPAGAPCMVRKLAGSTDFDADYYVDLDALTGHPTGALLQGAGGKAFLLVFDDETYPLDAENAAGATRLPGWEYYSVTLGDEANTLAKVPDVPAGAGYGIGFSVRIGDDAEPTPHVAFIAGDLSESAAYDVSDPTSFVERLTTPGFLGGIARLR